MVFLLYELLWTGNGLGVEGTELMANALASNRTLVTLDLSCTSRRETKRTIWQSFSNYH
jgi:hypothetical protein